MPVMDDETVRLAWIANARPWIRAVRDGAIPSRRAGSDQAVIDAVLRQRPTSVLDLGCGEGWLARALAQQGCDVVGVDAVPALVNEARLAGGGRFECLSYQALADGVADSVADGGLNLIVDLIVANFSLLGGGEVDRLFTRLPRLLDAGGHLVVQTLDPRHHTPYEDGWRPGSWAGIPGDFGEPAPWYYRTLQSWRSLFENNGLHITEESFHGDPDSGPASVIFVAEKAG